MSKSIHPAPPAPSAPEGEHEVKSTMTDDGFTEDHGARSDSPTFTHTKKLLHGSRCCITGHAEQVEQHHATLEWSLQFGVNWPLVKDIALGEVKELPVLDPLTFEPTGEMAPIEGFLIYKIVKFLEWMGFDWQAFDPEKPEMLVDSAMNMLAISKPFHTGPNGVHRHSIPFWLFYAWPRLPGYVYTPAELRARLAEAAAAQAAMPATG
jgi:hypothetical protein